MTSLCTHARDQLSQRLVLRSSFLPSSVVIRTSISVLLAARQVETEQIVKPATVDRRRDDLAPAEHFV
jgi:hypothetical protein